MPGLTITRRAGEQIRIGDALVTIQEIRGNRAIITIDAPRSTPITRPENDAMPLKDNRWERQSRAARFGANAHVGNAVQNTGTSPAQPVGNAAQPTAPRPRQTGAADSPAQQPSGTDRKPANAPQAKPSRVRP